MLGARAAAPKLDRYREPDRGHDVDRKGVGVIAFQLRQEGEVFGDEREQKQQRVEQRALLLSRPKRSSASRPAVTVSRPIRRASIAALRVINWPR